MKAIIFKELRENILWAGMVFLITSGLLILGVYQEFRSGIPLVEKTTITLCMLMYPVAGLSLGLLQVFLDSRWGRWQFLSHRPISRSWLFAGKLLAGLSMYGAATLLPFAAVAAWVAVPGHVAGPFTRDMAFPGLASIGSGLMWYATGLLVASRNARWFGSRIMPVGVPLLGTLLFAALAGTFALAIIVIFVLTALMLAAAWGAFISGGEPCKIPAGFKPWIGTSVAVGWLITVLLLMVMASEAINYLSEPRRESYTYRMYMLGPDGDLRTVTYGSGSAEPIQDLSGKVIGDFAADRSRMPQTELYLDSTDNRPSWTHPRDEGFMKAESHARWITSTTRENWCYVTSRRIIEGYDQNTRRYVGSFGSNGFAPPGKTSIPFTTDETLEVRSLGYHEPLLVFRNEVFFVDTENRRVSKLFFTPDSDPVLAASYLQSADVHGFNERDSTMECVVVTRNTIHVVRHDRELMTLPLGQLDERQEITVGRTRSGQFVVGCGVDFPAGFAPARVIIYDHEGKEIRRTDEPETREQEPSTYAGRPWWYQWGQLIPSPPAFFATIYTLHALDDGLTPWGPLAHLLLVIAGYLAIAFVMLRARHASRGQFIIWLIIAATLGLTGILLLMSMSEKLKSTRCQSCGRRRLVTESACRNCHTRAPVPVMEGIEIFEPALL